MKSLFNIAARSSTMHVVSATKLTAETAIKAAIDKAVSTLQEKLETIRELAQTLCYLDDNAELMELEKLLEALQESDVNVVETLRAAWFKCDFEFRVAPSTDNTVVVGAYRYLVQEQ
jgi:hypothetical protein